MMSEPKPIASLSSTLLARKGQAKPAMRPQGFAGFGMANAIQHDDLGWNDMGIEQVIAQQVSAEIVPISGEMPVPSPAPEVVRQQEELAREMTPVAPEPVAAPVRSNVIRAAPGSKGKAAFTLRLDPERHLKLRLVCAVAHTSAQQMVIAALDAFLDSHPAAAELVKSTPAPKR